MYSRGASQQPSGKPRVRVLTNGGSLRNLSIRTKLVAYQLIVAVPGLIIVGALAFTSGKAAFRQARFNHLTSVRASKANQIEAYFRRIRHQVETFSEDRTAVEAMRELRGAFRQLASESPTADGLEAIRDYYSRSFLPRLEAHGAVDVTSARLRRETSLEAFLPAGGAASYLQYLYIAANPHPPGEKEQLDFAADGSAYSEAHRRYHPILRRFLHKFGYYDLFLIDAESGEIVYSVFKETDCATRLVDGPYRGSNLAAAFEAVRRAPSPEAVRLVDFARYRPSYDAPAAFIASPIDDGEERLGVLAFQMPVGEIDQVMTGNRNWQADGLGASGETYLIGPDYRMRSNSRFILEDPERYFAALAKIQVPPEGGKRNTVPEGGKRNTVPEGGKRNTASGEIERMRSFGTSILLQEVRTSAAVEALAGGSRTDIVDDYRGIPVLSSYAPVEITDVDWAILSEIDVAEAFAPIDRFSRRLMAAAAVMLALIAALAVAFTRSLMAPIDALIAGAERFGQGDGRVEVPVATGDELGQLTETFNRMIAAIREKTSRLEQTTRENERLLLNILPASVAERLKAGELGARFEGLQKTLQAERKRAMEALAAYLPMDRRQATVRGFELPERAEGAVLFADISGFTPLTEVLAQELGPRQGAEELTRQLNRVYGALIGEVHRVRGSVVGFSGDAITCWFDGDDGRRALACGLNMQRVMTWFYALKTPSGETIPLAIKAAACRGPVRRFLTGDPEVQVLDVLAGATLDRMAVAEGLAELGEVVVGPEILETLGGALRLEAERRDPTGRRFGVVAKLRIEVEEDPWEVVAAGALDAEEVRPWLLPQVFERLRDGHGEFLADLRPVVALFLKFSGLDFEGEVAAGRNLDAYVRWVQGVVVSLGGSLIQLTTGDKGSYVYAVFGAPVALEDAAERAVAAALRLSSPPPGMAFITAVKIGLSQGRMRTGAYGSDTRHTYGVLGDETNLAARLMGRAAAGQVLVSQRIANRAGRSCRFRDLGQIEVKGKRQSIAIFEALARLGPGTMQLHPATEHRTTMIGRKLERRLLSVGVLALGAEGHNNNNFIVEGEAGIGKSRLVADIVEQVQGSDSEGDRVATDRVATDRGTILWLAAADPIQSSTAYYAWRAVFRQVLDLEQPGDRVAGDRVVGDLEAQRQRALECLRAAADHGGSDRDLVELAPLLNTVLPLDLPETERSALLQGEPRAVATRKFLVRLLRETAGGRPVVLVGEDAQWLDSASWRLIHRLRQEIRPLLLVIATRPLAEPLPRGYRRLVDQPETVTLALGALSPEETKALVSRRLGAKELPPPVTELIWEKAGGNPFFSEELADALRDTGLIRVEDGVCTVERNLGGLEFPETIEEVVNRRIDRLTPQQQTVLKVASVIGRVFAFDILRDVFPLADAKERLADLLAELVALDITPVESPEPALRYLFKDLVTREVAYTLMLFEQRRQLHRSVAEWYEQAHAADPAPVATLLAHHWSKAIERLEQAESAQVAKTVGYFLQAGRQALDNAASVEAVQHLTRGLELLEYLAESRERKGRELALRSALAVALIAARGPADDQVRRNFVRARQLCDQIGGAAQHFAVLTGLWYYHLMHADRAEAIGLAGELMDLAREADQPAFLITAHQAVGTASFFAGELERAHRHLGEVIALDQLASRRPDALTRVRNPVAVAHAYSAMILWFLGHPDQARDGYARAIAVGEEIDHPLTLTLTLFTSAAIEHHCRDLAAAERWAGRAVALAEEQGFPFYVAMGNSVLGWAAMSRGTPEKAVELLETSLETHAAGTRVYSPPILADLIKAQLQLGRLTAAAAAVDKALGLVDTQLAGFYQAELQRLRGEMLLLQEVEGDAESCFRRALEVARAQRARSFELRAATSLGRLWQRQGKAGEARELVSGVYDWFTEGFDTGDLRDARTLIEELSG